MKKPILMIGIIFFSIFLFDLARKGKLPLISKKTIATSCRSAVVMLNKRIPATWKTDCKENNLTVTIRSKVSESDPKKLSTALYREMANNLVFISKNSLNESLERTFIVRVQSLHFSREINAITEGQYIARLATMTRPELIAEHLKATVQVQEKPR